MKSKLYEICDKMLHNSWADQAEYEAAVNYLAKVEAEMMLLDPALADAMNELIRVYHNEMETESLEADRKREREKADKYMMKHPEEFGLTSTYPFHDPFDFWLEEESE